MEKISVYKNRITGKYHSFNFEKNETANIQKADKYNYCTGLITEPNIYDRVDFNEELVLLRKEKLKKLNKI